METWLTGSELTVKIREYLAFRVRYFPLDRTLCTPRHLWIPIKECTFYNGTPISAICFIDRHVTFSKSYFDDNFRVWHQFVGLYNATDKSHKELMQQNKYKLIYYGPMHMSPTNAKSFCLMENSTLYQFPSLDNFAYIHQRSTTVNPWQKFLFWIVNTNASTFDIGNASG